MLQYKNEEGRLVSVKGILSMTQEELKKGNLQLVLCGHESNEEGHCKCIGGGKHPFVILPGSGILFGTCAPTTFVQGVRFDVDVKERKMYWLPKAVAYSLKPEQKRIRLVINLLEHLGQGHIPDFKDFRDLPRLLTTC